MSRSYELVIWYLWLILYHRDALKIHHCVRERGEEKRTRTEKCGQRQAYGCHGQNRPQGGYNYARDAHDYIGTWLAREKQRPERGDMRWFFWDGVCISVGTLGYNVGRKLFQNKVALGFVRLCLAMQILGPG